MGNLGMSNFLTGLLEGMNKAQQSQSELESRREKLKLEQGRLKLDEKEMEMKYKENPFEQLTKGLDLEQKAAQIEKTKFDLAESQRKSMEAKALAEVQSQAKNDLSLLDEYFRTQGIKPKGAVLDRYHQLSELAGNSPDQTKTILETKGYIPRYKPTEPKEEGEGLSARSKYIADSWKKHSMDFMNASTLRQMNPEQQDVYRESKFEEFGKEFDRLKGEKKGSVTQGGKGKIKVYDPKTRSFK